MTDRVTDTLAAALKTALLDPCEHRLYKSGKLDGLFPGRGGPSGEAAARALRDGLLDIVRTEVKGKTTIEWVRLAPQGVEYLHRLQSPAVALRELSDTLRANQAAVPVWLAEMRGALQALDERLAADAGRWLTRLEAMGQRVDDALRRLQESNPAVPPELAEAYPWAADALDYLDGRRAAGAEGECPLPELFTALARPHATLSVGSSHEGLRRLHERRILRLLPAPGLDTLAQPEYALLRDGAVLYFAAR